VLGNLAGFLSLVGLGRQFGLEPSRAWLWALQSLVGLKPKSAKKHWAKVVEVSGEMGQTFFSI